MSDFATRFSSKRQDWATPDELFLPLDREFSFTLDAAADASNAKVPGNYFTAEQDGIIQDWGTHTVWLNPPYGDRQHSIAKWVEKCYRASLEGATCVILIPARTNTGWFHDYCLKYGEVRFIRGRPKFGDADHGLPQPLCLVVFRPC